MLILTSSLPLLKLCSLVVINTIFMLKNHSALTSSESNSEPVKVIIQLKM